MAGGTAFSVERWVQSVLRIVVGFTFTLHGFQKLFGLFGGPGGHGATAHPFSLFWFAAIIESIGGPLIVLGLFTRPVAFILSGEMAIAYLMFHFPRGFWPIKNGGELALLYCFIYLYIFTAGPDPLSADHLARRK